MKKIVNKIREDKSILAQIISALLIIFMCLYNISNMNYPVVNGDSFGYWSNAVSICGYDWKELIARNSYYSWGYSLWLVPIVKLLPHGLWYKAAVILNAAFLVTAYFFANSTAKIMFPKVGRLQISLIALVVIIYPSNIMYAQETWTESLMYMLMWCATWLLVSMEGKFYYKNFFLFYTVLGYMYVVHARSIGIVGVGIVLSLIILYKNHKKILPAIIAIIIFACMYLLNDIFKGYIIDNFYGNSQTSNINNVGLDSGTISTYISRIFNNVKLLAKSVLAKNSYFLLMSGFAIIPAVCVCIEKLVAAVKKENSEFVISHIWCIMAFFASLGVCALQMINWYSRKDVIVYSRYYENACGPVLLLGIIYIIEASPKIRLSVIVGWLINLLVMPRIIYCVNNAEGYFNFVCSPSFGVLYDNAVNMRTLKRLILVIESTFVIMTLACIVIGNKKYTLAAITGTFALVYIVINIAGAFYLREYRLELDKRFEPMREIIEGQGNANLYYLCENTTDDSAEILQFIMWNNKIRVIENENVPVEAGAYLLTDKVITEIDGGMYNVMYQRDGIYLYRYKTVD